MTSRPRSRLTRLAVAVLATLALAPPAEAAGPPAARPAADPGYVAGEVVVRVRNPRTGAIEARRHVIRDGDSVRETARELERRADVVHEDSPYDAGADPVEFNFDWSFQYYPLAYHRPGTLMTVFRLRGGRCAQ